MDLLPPPPHVVRLPLDRVRPDPNQPRKTFDDAALAELAASLKEHGQRSPINVRMVDGGYLIIAGERRWRACGLAGLDTIVCQVDTAELSPAQVSVLSLVENCQREDLKPLELAQAFREVMAANGWTGKELAERVSVSPAYVCRTLALLELPEDLQAKLDAGELSAHAAYEISKLAGADMQREVAQEVIAGGLARDDVRAAVDERRGKKRGRKLAKFTAKLSKGWTLTVTAPRRTLSAADVAEAVGVWLGTINQPGPDQAAA